MRISDWSSDVFSSDLLLAEAGFPNGFETDIYAYRQREYTEAAIGYLAKVGIKATLKFMQFKVLRGLVWDNATPFNQMTWGSNSINAASASVSHRPSERREGNEGIITGRSQGSSH